MVLCINIVSCNIFYNYLLVPRVIFVDVFRFSTKKIMLSVNKDSYFFLPCLQLLRSIKKKKEEEEPKWAFRIFNRCVSYFGQIIFTLRPLFFICDVELLSALICHISAMIPVTDFQLPFLGVLLCQNLRTCLLFLP